MARARTFRSEAAATGTDDQPAEPITFTLEGGPPLSPAPWSETFTCLLEAPASALDDLVMTAGADERGRRQWNAPSLTKFLMGVVIAGDEQRLWDTLHDKAKIVGIDTLGELTMWLAEELTGNPMTPPSS